MKDIIYIIIIIAAVIVTWLLTPKRAVPVIKKINRIEIDNVSYMLAINHIRHYEGLRLMPYEFEGKYYIGYGHQIRSYEPYLMDGITAEYADTLLINDLNHRILTANRYYNVTGTRALAVAMLMYNLGDGRVAKSGEDYTTVHRMLCGWIPYEDHAFRASWMSFCKIKGEINKRLKERREYELSLWFNNK